MLSLHISNRPTHATASALVCKTILARLLAESETQRGFKVMSDDTDMMSDLGIGVWRITAVLEDETSAGHMHQTVFDGWSFV